MLHPFVFVAKVSRRRPRKCPKKELRFIYSDYSYYTSMSELRNRANLPTIRKKLFSPPTSFFRRLDNSCKILPIYVSIISYAYSFIPFTTIERNALFDNIVTTNNAGVIKNKIRWIFGIHNRLVFFNENMFKLFAIFVFMFYCSFWVVLFMSVYVFFYCPTLAAHFLYNTLF